jgi:hypothetical protein
MLDVDSLPDMYETMIDRPALIYDSLSNLTYSFTKNITTICSFFVNELNYTYEQCEEIFNHTIINTNQVRQNRMKEKRSFVCIYFQQRKKRDFQVGEHFAVILTRKKSFLLIVLTPITLFSSSFF